MIIVYHHNNTIQSVFDSSTKEEVAVSEKGISDCLFELAQRFPDELLVWCHSSQKDNLNIEAFSDVFHHKKMMVSFSDKNFFPDAIGYVESSPFIKINKNVSYPTWQMSSLVGGIYTCVLNKFQGKIKTDINFDYFLNSLAKQGMPNGLFCYSEPKLLLNTTGFPIPKASLTTLFRFVKQHYKIVWVFLLFFNLAVYEKRFPFSALFLSLFYKKRALNNNVLDSIEISSSKKVITNKTIDVIIPTIGRKKYLYDVLKDLNQQTHLPKNVIIVEQNPDLESTSELDYLTSEKWNFNTKHTFTHQPGACNARNIALSQVESEWVFFADDDIRIEKNFLKKGLTEINKTGNVALTFNCLRKNEKVIFKQIKQWGTFGSGCSVVNSEILKHTFFDIRYEFGFGEDGDFGMQLRNKGIDVIYLPEPQILHLKAPMGGFRTKPVLAWHNETIQPKPSPTVMLYNILHNMDEQLLGYKTLLFIKFYNKQSVRNPFSYIKKMREQWNVSIKWATTLKDKSA